MYRYMEDIDAILEIAVVFGDTSSKLAAAWVALFVSIEDHHFCSPETVRKGPPAHVRYQ